jgi:excisionase family DNA binding protein
MKRQAKCEVTNAGRARRRQAMLQELRQSATCSIEEAAILLGIGRSTAYAAAHDGSLPVLKLSHRLLVSVPRLLRMIEGDS